jgi:hypothetical protein
MNKKMYNYTIFFFSFFLFACPFLRGTNEKEQSPVDVIKNIPFLLQNIRPYETVEFEYIKEECSDANEWKSVLRRHVVSNPKENYFRIDSVSLNESNKEKLLDYENMSYVNGKLLRLSYLTPFRTSLPLKPVGAFSRTAILQKQQTTLSENDSFLSFREQDDRKMELYNLLTNASILKDVVIKQNEKTISVFDVYITYVFDKHTGLLLEKRYDPVDDFVVIKLQGHIRKNGYVFPRVLYIEEKAQKDGKIKIYKTRFTMVEDSLIINKQYNLADFSIQIPVGTRVYDTIENREYITTRELDNMDIEAIEKQLDALIQKANQSKEGGKK